MFVTNSRYDSWNKLTQQFFDEMLLQQDALRERVAELEVDVEYCARVVEALLHSDTRSLADIREEFDAE